MAGRIDIRFFVVAPNKTCTLTHCRKQRTQTHQPPPQHRIVSIMVFPKLPDRQVLQDFIVEKFLIHARLRSKFVPKGKGGYFEEVLNVDLNYHIISYPDGCTETDVDDAAAAAYNWQIDKDKPLWKLELFPNMTNGKAMIMLVANHCIADGMGFVSFFLSLSSGMEEKNEKLAKTPVAGGAATAKAGGGRSSLWWPTRIKAKMYGFYEGACGPFWSPDPLSVLKLKSPSNKKLIASSGFIALASVNELRDKLRKRVSVNDVLMAILTRVVKKVYEAHGDKNTLFRVSFPVNLRRPNTELDLRNQFNFALMNLPIKHKDAMDCLLQCRRNGDYVKASNAASIKASLFSTIITVIPSWYLSRKVSDSAKIATCTLSNVKGPPNKLKIFGETVEQMRFFLHSIIGMYVGVLSYGGDVAVSVSVDEAIGIPAKEIADLWTPEYEKLRDEIMAMSDKEIKKRV